MNDMVMIILNIFAMLWIIYFAIYISAELEAQNIKLFRRLFKTIFKLDLSYLKEIKAKRYYLWGYLLIPALLLTVLVMCRQFRIGKMYIRPESGFFIAAMLWLSLTMFVIGTIKNNKKQ